MIAKSKIIENFCVIDEFNKNFDKEISNHALISYPVVPSEDIICLFLKKIIYLCNILH